MSRNSASNLTALSERMSMDFRREITKVTRNCPLMSMWTDEDRGGQTYFYISVWPYE
jgi:hypothetical protein